MTDDLEATEEKITCTKFHTFALRSRNERHDRRTARHIPEEIRTLAVAP
jgi:hypothetical protein